VGFLYFCSVFSFSTLIPLVGRLTCKTVSQSQTTYTVSVHNQPCSINQSPLYSYLELLLQAVTPLLSL